jgi:hypothetical protein
MVMQTAQALRMQKLQQAKEANVMRKRTAIIAEFNRLYEATPKGRHVNINIDAIYQDVANSFYVSKATVTKILKTA